MDLTKFSRKLPHLLTDDFFIELGACARSIKRFKDRFPTGILLENITKNDLFYIDEEEISFLVDYLLTLDAFNEYENKITLYINPSDEDCLELFCKIVGIE